MDSALPNSPWRGATGKNFINVAEPSVNPEADLNADLDEVIDDDRRDRCKGRNAQPHEGILALANGKGGDNSGT